MPVLADSEPIELPPMPKPEIIGYSNLSVIQRYQVLDLRFCFLTPDQFLCKKCIENDMQFVRLLHFDEAGRPLRFYGCRRWQNRYFR